MAEVITQSGELYLLDGKRTKLNTLTARLYKNNYDPTPTSSIGDFTEADFDGYASQALNDFGAVYTNGSGEGETDTGVHTWVMTGAVTPNTVYGWFAEQGGTVVMAAKNPSGGFLMDSDGKTFSIQIKFKSVGV